MDRLREITRLRDNKIGTARKRLREATRHYKRTKLQDKRTRDYKKDRLQRRLQDIKFKVRRRQKGVTMRYCKAYKRIRERDYLRLRDYKRHYKETTVNYKRHTTRKTTGDTTKDQSYYRCPLPENQFTPNLPSLPTHLAPV